MQHEVCINLCDIAGYYEQRYADAAQIIETICKQARLPQPTRIVLGSNFCANYFLGMSDRLVAGMARYCQAKGLGLTLTAPIFSQRLLARGKARVEELLDRYAGAVDEVTVNDYGMLCQRSLLAKVKVVMGRLFWKEYRDCRYPEFDATPYRATFLNDDLSTLLDQNGVTGIELDILHTQMDLSQIPAAYSVGLHTPYTYITTGQICQYASTDQPATAKFRPNEPCALPCMQQAVGYRLPGGEHSLKVGRTVYYEQALPQVTGRQSLRLLHFPLPIRRTP